MKRKWIPAAAAVLCLLASAALIADLKYDLKLAEYLRYSLPLSSSEKSYLEEKGSIICGVDRNAPPLSFVDGATGQNAGLVPDYMSSLSIELGVTIPCEPLVWSDIMTGLESGKIDTSDLFVSEERQKKYDFTQSIYVLRGGIAVNSNNTEINGPGDLGGKRIAVPDDDYAEEYIRRLYEGSADKPVVIPVHGISAGIDLLSSGGCDAVAGDETVIYYVINNREKPQSFRVAEDALYEQDVTLAVRKGEDELLSALNKGILRLKKKDILTKTQEKWFGVSAPIIKDSAFYNLISRVILTGVLAAVLFYFWNAVLRRKIREKTRELEINKSDLRNIIDALHVYLLVIDRENRIVECNTLTEELLAVPRDEILFTSPDSHPLLKEILQGRENPGPTRVGSRYFSLVQRELDAVPGTLLLTLEDVTEKIVSERRLRQEGKMAAVGQLSAGLAHEIRNPLGLIKNYLYIMRRYMTDDAGQHAVTVAGESVERINGLIDNLLSFSRISGDSEHDVPVLSLLTRIIRLEEKRLHENQIQTEVHCGEELLAYTNEEALKLILFNLIDNAADAFSEQETLLREREWEDGHGADGTGGYGAGADGAGGYSSAEYDSGEVGSSDIDSGEASSGEYGLGDTVAAPERRLELYAETRGADLHIRVCDNACGISEEQLELIFNPFFTTKDTGTGLGLYIVSSEAEKLGGSVTAESSAAGTCFELTLPGVVRGKEAQGSQETQGSQGTQGASIDKNDGREGAL